MSTASIIANYIEHNRCLASFCRERQDSTVKSRFLALFRCKFCLPSNVGCDTY